MLHTLRSRIAGRTLELELLITAVCCWSVLAHLFWTQAAWCAGWGGDLASFSSHLDYIQQLGTDVLYLNPIHLAYTNHKYDALDFQEISPEFGDRTDFIRLAADVHYYGSEVGMTGGGDPENRGPMRWDLVRTDNPELVWIKQLIGMRKQCRALRIGNFRLVDSDHLLAFERYTERALETVVVLANPSSAAITERVMIANAGLMDDTPLMDVLAPRTRQPPARNRPS